jgi:hypothetical protein
VTHDDATAAPPARNARLRPGLLTAAAAETVLLAAACHGGGGPPPGASATPAAQTRVQQVDAYAQCKRKNGELMRAAKLPLPGSSAAGQCV